MLEKAFSIQDKTTWTLNITDVSLDIWGERDMLLGHRFYNKRLPTQLLSHILQAHYRKCNGKNIEQESGNLASIFASAMLWDWKILALSVLQHPHLQKLMIALDYF